MSEAQHLLTEYCAAIDRREDPEGVAERFWTDDGVLDNTAIGSPLVEGRAALAEAYAAMFAATTWMKHELSAFRAVEGGIEAAVGATGQPVGGEAFTMGGTYRAEMKRESDGWKLTRLTFTP